MSYNNSDVRVGGRGDLIASYSTYRTKVLPNNLVDHRNVLTQLMMNTPNTKYVIKWDYVLNESITLPKGCLIEFDGGSIRNDNGNEFTLTGNDTIVIFYQDRDKIVKDVELLGNFIFNGSIDTADEEDITGKTGVLKFADKDYDPENFSGLGRVYLRKNIGAPVDPDNNIWCYKPSTDELVYLMYRYQGVYYHIYDEGTGKGLVLHNNIVKETDEYNVANLPEPAQEHNMPYIKNGDRLEVTLPDNTVVDDSQINNTEIFYYVDEEGDESQYAGKNILTQDMISKSNTIYIIQYDFILGEDITVPANCILRFDGGSISNGTVVGQNTGIDAELVKIFNTDIVINGSWNVEETYPEWFGAKAHNGIDDSDAIQKSLAFPSKLTRFTKLYYISKPISLNSIVHIVGNYGMHTYQWGISVNNDFTSIIYNGQTIKSIFYLKSTPTAPLIMDAVYFNGAYKANTLVHCDVGSFKYGIRLYRCHLFRMYEAGVMFIGSDGNIARECLIQYCGAGIAGCGRKINFNNFSSISGTIIGRPNHTIIEDCIFNRCNVGIDFQYASDCIFRGNLFGYDSLYTLIISEVKNVTISENYIEGDWNCKFWIEENGSDPGSNAGWDISNYVLPSLKSSGKASVLRGYIFLYNSNVTIHSCYFSNYYIRSYSGAGKNAYTNGDVSGIDGLVRVKFISNLEFGRFYSTSNMKVNNVNVTPSYDVVTENLYHSEISKIVSTVFVRVRNYISNATGKNYAYAIDRQVIQILEKGNISSILGTNIINKKPDGTSADFFNAYTYVQTLNGIEFYTRTNYDPTKNNSLYIPASYIPSSTTAQAEIYYYGSVPSSGIDITAEYSDGTFETKRYCYEQALTTFRKIVCFFTKDEFVRDDKTLVGIYVHEDSYMAAGGTGCVSAVRLILDDGIPKYLSLPTSGTTRPKIGSNAKHSFLDTTLNKVIDWNGSKWVEQDGAVAGVRRVGSYAQRPSSNDIYNGFEYINTDTKRNIYYRSNKWIDADGANTEAKREGTMFERPSGTDIFVGFRFMDRTLGKPVFADSIAGSNVKWIDSDGNMSQLPNGYTPVEAITGNVSDCRIDTGITGSDDIEIECIFQDNSWVANAPFFGCHTDGSSNSTRLQYNTSNDYTALINVNNKGQNASPITFIAATKHSVILNKSGIIVDGVFQSLYQDVAGTAQAQTIIINNFNLNTPSSIGTRTITWWSFSIRKAGVRVFSGIPCVRVSDGKVGLYDVVTNAFFGNAMSGDGEFEVYQG